MIIYSGTRAELLSKAPRGDFAVSRVTLNNALAREGLNDRPAAPADKDG